jgi:hypothetical protein
VVVAIADAVGVGLSELHRSTGVVVVAAAAAIGIRGARGCGGGGSMCVIGR